MPRSCAVRSAPHCPMKALFVAAGTLALVLAFLGLFLPLLPTTPFLLLASACYVRGSDRMYHWLMHNRLFGEHLRAIRAKEGIPMRAKLSALLFLWGSLSWSAWMMPVAWARPLLLIPGIGVTIYLLRMPTRRKPATTKRPPDQIRRE